MGVYAKKMKMPKTCFDCIKSGLQIIVGCTEWENTTAGVRERFRVRFCPLVEVSEPHGRLIDVGALEEEHIDYATGDVVPISWSDISYAPTVIEAESD